MASLSVAAQQMTMPMGTTLKYMDDATGKTADGLLSLAIANNAELEAMRKEAAASEQLIKQAGLRPNPSVELSGARQINGSDNSEMVRGELPLELGGRRGTRIRVAQRELEIRQQAVAEQERQLAAEVRTKFGESLAAIVKLMFTEEMLALAE